MPVRETTDALSSREAVLAQQKRDWPKHLEGGRAGNAYATMCLHCYGRHAPPKDGICPHEPPARELA